MSGSFQEFETVVRDIWSGYRANVQPIWNLRLSQYPFDRLIGVLNQHRADNPDEMKPLWKTIYRNLAAGDSSAGKSDLYILLDQTRRLLRKDPACQKCQPENTRTDADVFENYLEANTRPTLRQMNGVPYPDPDGRRARLAASERAEIVNRYVTDLEERGDPVPAWLVR